MVAEPEAQQIEKDCVTVMESRRGRDMGIFEGRRAAEAMDHQQRYALSFEFEITHASVWDRSLKAAHRTIPKQRQTS
jgi:hypothetical protein